MLSRPFAVSPARQHPFSPAPPRRLPDARFVVPPTALHELALAARTGGTERIRKAAFRALSQLRAWGFEPLNLVPVGHGIVERIAGEIRHKVWWQRRK